MANRLVQFSTSRSVLNEIRSNDPANPLRPTTTSNSPVSCSPVQMASIHTHPWANNTRLLTRKHRSLHLRHSTRTPKGEGPKFRVIGMEQFGSEL
ncbi:hypothetical protein PM082_008264 [Marasmius tenuissimus]|nr:hypothetical protein PM082_008264 [Marasmius tenuissimus]